MNIPFILSSLPSLVIVKDVFIDDSNLLKNQEFLRGVIVFHLTSDSIDLLHELVDLLELDQKDLVANYALDQVHELFSCQDVKRNKVNIQLFVWHDAIILEVHEIVFGLWLLLSILTWFLILIHVLLDHLQNLLMVH